MSDVRVRPIEALARLRAFISERALRSMAQTRATAKALRLPLGFVMTLAGYEATPAEEMPADIDQRPAPKGWQGPRRKATARDAGESDDPGTARARRALEIAAQWAFNEPAEFVEWVKAQRARRGWGDAGPLTAEQLDELRAALEEPGEGRAG